MKPRIRTSLCISGETLNLSDITHGLNIIPTKVRYRDDFPEVSKKMGFANDEWIYSSQKTVCNSISKQIDEIEKVFGECVEKLNQICKRFNAKITIVIEIEMEVGEHPELHFSRKNIKFISSINSEIGIDPYINTNEE